MGIEETKNIHDSAYSLVSKDVNMQSITAQCEIWSVAVPRNFILAIRLTGNKNFKLIVTSINLSLGWWKPVLLNLYKMVKAFCSLLAEVSHEEAKMRGERDLCQLLTRYLMKPPTRKHLFLVETFRLLCKACAAWDYCFCFVCFSACSYWAFIWFKCNFPLWLGHFLFHLFNVKYY